MRLRVIILVVLFGNVALCQQFDSTRYQVSVEFPEESQSFFTTDPVWRGADGASSIDLGSGKVLWLFSDSFVSTNGSQSRKGAEIIRNSVAIQTGYDFKTAKIRYYWNKSGAKPTAFFQNSDKYWFWTGHGALIKDKLIIFLFKEHEIKTGLGFETVGWGAALVSNPHDEPSEWKMTYIDGPETYGTIAGSAAVLSDENYLYAYGAVEPGTHEVYLLRWKLANAYTGNLSHPEWHINGTWSQRKAELPLPKPLFMGQTEYSVHYDASIRKYIQIQSFGFGAGKLGIRMSDQREGPWTEPYMFYTPAYPGVKRPFMYSAKAHPELNPKGLYITYNVNSFDFGELLENQSIYFPKLILMKIVER